MEGLAGAELRVKVVDTNGDVLPGIPVKATATDTGDLVFTKAATATGWATLQVPGAHDYKLVVEHPGFVRRSGVLTAVNGCRLEMVVSLKVKSPTEVIY